jgi:hypothetical protein
VISLRTRSPKRLRDGSILALDFYFAAREAGRGLENDLPSFLAVAARGRIHDGKFVSLLCEIPPGTRPNFS